MIKLKLIVTTMLLIFSCSSQKPKVIAEKKSPQTISILALGDSYTIGESVCETCRFPEQLKSSLKEKLNTNSAIQLDIIAKTGWTTSDLKQAIKIKNQAKNYNLVTLLIGVNNQYQNKPFSLYKTEFPELAKTAIQKANNDKSKIIVVSIPDYAFTPFGKQNPKISKEIDNYNAFAKNYCNQNNITYVNITDITRQGINEPNLVAKDGLHPSKIAYSKFVERLLPNAIEILK